MGWIFKPFSVLRALLLLPLAISKPGDVSSAPDDPEDEAWAQSLSVGTPQALQEFISLYPDSSKVESAFDLIVEFQVETAKTKAWSQEFEVQVAQDREILEFDFDTDTY